jgi:hypothetical protein
VSVNYAICIVRPNQSLKPIAHCAGIQRLATVGVDSWGATVVSAGGGLAPMLVRQANLAFLPNGKLQVAG